MSSLSFVSGPRTDKSFSIGLGLVTLFALAEIGAVGIHFIGTMRPAHVSVAPREVPAPLSSTAPSAPPVALTVSSPTAQLPPPTTVSSEIDRLTKQAQAARESGDTVNAVARLQDAAQRDPRNAEALAEMAMIYESTQNFDKSAETWKRVQEIGPSAGPLYDVADTKLRTGVPMSTSSAAAAPAPTARSEERRVGKECRARQ